jgi:hypothetical protein
MVTVTQKPNPHQQTKVNLQQQHHQQTKVDLQQQHHQQTDNNN